MRDRKIKIILIVDDMNMHIEEPEYLIKRLLRLLIDSIYKGVEPKYVNINCGPVCAKNAMPWKKLESILTLKVAQKNHKYLGIKQSTDVEDMNEVV